VQITRVSPTEISAEPSAVRTNPGSTSTSRSWPTARPSVLLAVVLAVAVSSEPAMAGCYSPVWVPLRPNRAAMSGKTGNASP